MHSLEVLLLLVELVHSITTTMHQASLLDSLFLSTSILPLTTHNDVIMYVVKLNIVLMLCININSNFVIVQSMVLKFIPCTQTTIYVLARLLLHKVCNQFNNQYKI